MAAADVVAGGKLGASIMVRVTVVKVNSSSDNSFFLQCQHGDHFSPSEPNLRIRISPALFRGGWIGRCRQSSSHGERCSDGAPEVLDASAFASLLFRGSFFEVTAGVIAEDRKRRRLLDCELAVLRRVACEPWAIYRLLTVATGGHAEAMTDALGQLHSGTARIAAARELVVGNSSRSNTTTTGSSLVVAEAGKLAQNEWMRVAKSDKLLRRAIRTICDDMRAASNARSGGRTRQRARRTTRREWDAIRRAELRWPVLAGEGDSIDNQDGSGGSRYSGKGTELAGTVVQAGTLLSVPGAGWGLLDPRLNLPDPCNSARKNYIKLKKKPQIEWMLQKIADLIEARRSAGLIKAGQRAPTKSSCSHQEPTAQAPTSKELHSTSWLPSSYLSSSSIPETEPSGGDGNDGAPAVAHLVDVGGGRGDLAIAAAATLPNVRVTVVDLNKASLEAGRTRAAELQLGNIEFVLGDLATVHLCEGLACSRRCRRSEEEYECGSVKVSATLPPDDEEEGQKRGATESSVLVNFSVRNEAVTPGPSPQQAHKGHFADDDDDDDTAFGDNDEDEDNGGEGNYLGGGTDGRTSRNACTGIDVVFGLHCCGGLSEAAVALAIRHAAAFAICTCCFRSHPHLAVLSSPPKRAEAPAFSAPSALFTTSSVECDGNTIPIAASISSKMEEELLPNSSTVAAFKQVSSLAQTAPSATMSPATGISDQSTSMVRGASPPPPVNRTAEMAVPLAATGMTVAASDACNGKQSPNLTTTEKLYSGMVLAPMVRCGTLPLRALALRMGCQTAWGEELVALKLVSCRRVENRQLNTVDFVCPDTLKRGNDGGSCKGGGSGGCVVLRTCRRIECGRMICQLGAATPEIALAAAKVVEGDVDGIDVNMGCPKPFSVQGGMGAALLALPDTAEAIVRILAENLSVPVSAKIRLLPTRAETVAFAVRLAHAGARCVTVHCRFPAQREHEAAHWGELAPIVRALRPLGVPVIANGDMYRREDAAAIMASTGCAGVMLGRPALFNLSLFRSNVLAAEQRAARADSAKSASTSANPSSSSNDSSSLGDAGKGATLMPIETIVRLYLEECIRWDCNYQNAKYTVMEMLNNRRHPKSYCPAKPNLGPGRTMSDVSQTRSVKELAALFGVSDAQHDDIVDRRISESPAGWHRRRRLELSALPPAKSSEAAGKMDSHGCRRGSVEIVRTGATEGKDEAPLSFVGDGGVVRVTSAEYDDLKALAILAESDDSKMQLKAMTLINRCRLTVALSKFSVQYSAAMGVKNDGQVTAVKRRRTNIDGDDGQCARKLASGIQYRSSSGTLVLLVRQDYFSSDFSHRNRVLIGSVGCR